MKRNSLFWGFAVLLLGVVLLVSNLNILKINGWTLFWPLLLVLLGVWFLLGPALGKKSMDTVQTTIPMENTTAAEVSFHHGAGRLEVNGSARPGELLNGWFTGGVTSEIHRNAGYTELQLNAPADIPFEGSWPMGNHGFEWIVGLTPEVPLKLVFKTGASESVLDLSSLKVTSLSVDTGASSTEMTLPANAGLTTASVKSGVASVKIHIPAGVAAHINVQSGLSGINIDTTRFIKDGSNYVSSDYATAINKVDLSVEMGVGSVDIN
jgi:hypothetical protein